LDILGVINVAITCTKNL